MDSLTVKGKVDASAMRTLANYWGHGSWYRKRTKLRSTIANHTVLIDPSYHIQTQLYYETQQLLSNRNEPSSHKGWNIWVNNNNTATRHYLPEALYTKGNIPPQGKHMPEAYNTCPSISIINIPQDLGVTLVLDHNCHQPFQAQTLDPKLISGKQTPAAIIARIF